MRVNVYAEEMTQRIQIVSKTVEDTAFTGLRFFLELPASYHPGGKNQPVVPAKPGDEQQAQHLQAPFIHHPGDDDSSAVTFWGKRDLREVMRKALSELDTHYGDSPAMPKLATRFAANDDGTVTDHVNGLQWQAEDDGIRRKHAEAEKYCTNLRLADHTDWRLPTEEELLTLVDRRRYKPAINTELFPRTRSDFYWSSTPVAELPEDFAWGVNFYYGDASIYGRAFNGFVRAVRSVSPASPGQ